MPYTHSIYGLRLKANLPIPGLPPLREPHRHLDLAVHLKLQPPFDWSWPDGEEIYSGKSHGNEAKPPLRVFKRGGGRYFGFFYRDGARFAIRSDGGEVWADWPSGYSLEDAATYLVGPVLGFVLRLKGISPLHASAVEIGGRAVVIVGPPGAGKSTTAAAFAHLGHAVLSDDVAALREQGNQFYVAPGYPRVNLWPDSVRALHGSEDALPRITPTWSKCYVPLDCHGRFASRSLPLRAIYLLGTRGPAKTAPEIEEVAASDALLSLVANTYVNYVLNREMRHAEFDLLTRLVSSIPLRRIHPADDTSRVAESCQAIVRDLDRLRAAPYLPTGADSICTA